MYDMKNLDRLKDIVAEAPSIMEAFDRFATVAVSDCALSRKTKELIAVAVAHATQCPYCLEYHLTEARNLGATKKEIVEAAWVAAAIRAGGAFMYMSHLRK
jgi:AhpD family alkylhydroperoxidase